MLAKIRDQWRLRTRNLMETKVIRENLKAWSIFQRKKVIIEHSKNAKSDEKCKSRIESKDESKAIGKEDCMTR